MIEQILKKEISNNVHGSDNEMTHDKFPNSEQNDNLQIMKYYEYMANELKWLPLILCYFVPCQCFLKF